MKMFIPWRQMQAKSSSVEPMSVTTVLIALFVVFSSFQAGAAQADFEVVVTVTTCEQEPTSFPFQGGDCVPEIGAVVVVTDTDGSLIGTCISEEESEDSNTAMCSVSVPFGESIVITVDEATITSGYEPTHNPQSFTVPDERPDGVMGGPVFLNLPVPAAQAEERTAGEPVRTQRQPLEIVGEPLWWIVPNADGWGNTEEGRLYFAAYVYNPNARIVEVGVSFRAYDADNVPFPGCKAPVVEGPGVTTTIAPGETALLRCSRTIVPITMNELKVTAQLWQLDTLPENDAPVTLRNAEIVPESEQFSPMESLLDATVLATAQGNSDVETEILFRFYDKDGVQVGTCESSRVVLEPGIDQRVGCSYPLLIDTVGPQPAYVTAEPSPGLD